MPPRCWRAPAAALKRWNAAPTGRRTRKTLIHQARTIAAPTALHNNCSGKHAGFVCACCHQDIDPKGYIGYGHPLQREIRATMESLTGAVLGHDNCGTDGCSIPTYAVPLRGLAHGFAKMATGRGLEPLRAKASRRIFDACMAEPFYVAGTGRACTELMQIAPGRIFCKTGAEGVFCAAIPEQGISIAVKCEDGTTRAAEAMVAAALARFFEKDSDVHAKLTAMTVKPMHNWNGIHVGDIRVTAALFGYSRAVAAQAFSQNQQSLICIKPHPARADARRRICPTMA